MKEICVRWIVPAALACVVFSGCAKTPRPPKQTTRPTSEPITATSPASVRIGELSTLSEQYSTLSHQLPGDSPEQYRQLMHSAFGQLDQILSLLSDPHSDLVFRQHLLVLEDARTQLAGSPPAATVDPTVDTGLRSAYNALSTVAHDKDFADTDFTSQFADMKTRLDQLDTVLGPTHQVIVGEAVEASSVIVSRMAEILASRIPPEPTSEPATTQSTSEPATSPTSESSTATATTEPTTAPASQTAATQPGAAVPKETTQPGAAVPPAPAK